MATVYNTTAGIHDTHDTDKEQELQVNKASFRQVTNPLVSTVSSGETRTNNIVLFISWHVPQD